MKLKILGWFGVVWGGFVLVNGGLRLASGGVEGDTYFSGQMLALALGAFMFLAGIWTLRTGPVASTKNSSLNDFATRYTAAWCSQNAASVAAFFARHGSLTINGKTPAVGRTAITQAAQGFMTAFPDMVVTMDRLDEDKEDKDDGVTIYHWTLAGTNTGPGGTGRSVRISGYEEWVIGSDGLIVDSQGHFDQADYERQLRG
jgi:hypothetical protein